MTWTLSFLVVQKLRLIHSAIRKKYATVRFVTKKEARAMRKSLAGVVAFLFVALLGLPALCGIRGERRTWPSKFS
jgi:hypothetical protein